MKTDHRLFLIVLCMSFFAAGLNAQVLPAWDSVLELPVSPGSNAEMASASAYDLNHDRFLVVWSAKTGDMNYDIYGQLFGSDGSTYGSLLPVCTAENIQSHPDVDYDRVNQRFLVVWEDRRNNDQMDIYGVLLDAEGAKIQPQNTAAEADLSFPICNEPTSWQIHAKVAHNYTDDTYLVVWTDERITYPSMAITSDDIFAQRVGSDGGLLSPYDPPNSALNYPIAKADWDESMCDVAYHAGNAQCTVNEWMVVWVRIELGGSPLKSRVYGRRIDGATGLPLDNMGGERSLPDPSTLVKTAAGLFTAEFPIGYDGAGFPGMVTVPFFQGSPHIISNDNWPEGIVKASANGYDYKTPEFLVAWTDFRNSEEADPMGQGDIYCQRIAYFPDAAAKEIGLKPPESANSRPAIGMLDAEGNLPDPVADWITWPNIPVSDAHFHQSWNDLTYNQNEGDYVVAWNDWRPDRTEDAEAHIYAQRLYIDPADASLKWVDNQGNEMANTTQNIPIASTSADEGCANYPALSHSTAANHTLITYDFTASDRMSRSVRGTLVGQSGTAVPLSGRLPDGFVLYGNYPNPFNPQTVIRFGLPYADHVRIQIYDISGREIITLSDDAFLPGCHEIVWSGTDTQGQAAASGLYVYRIVTGQRSFQGKMMLLH